MQKSIKEEEFLLCYKQTHAFRVIAVNVSVVERTALADMRAQPDGVRATNAVSVSAKTRNATAAIRHALSSRPDARIARWWRWRTRHSRPRSHTPHARTASPSVTFAWMEPRKTLTLVEHEDCELLM